MRPNPITHVLSLVFAGVFLPFQIWAGQAEEADIFDFFKEEAEAIRVVTASRLLLTRRQAPATVYVVTAEDIEASGAKTLWDALRGVPGVDVMATRTFFGEVSVRGLNRALGTRTLVLLDGRTVLNGPFDSTFWEGISASMEEIDRIEVVEGPASALYGANAINGVINIITKQPAQLNGGQVSYTAGEWGTNLGSVVYGSQKGRFAYKASAGWRSTNRFEDAGLAASDVGKVHAFLGYELPGDSRLDVSGGLANYNTQFSIGSGGTAFATGAAGFLRLDYAHRDTRFRAFWNHGQPRWKGFQGLQDPRTNYGNLDLNLEHTLSLPFQNSLVVGGSFRRNTMRSNVYSPARINQNLWAVFLEEAWRPTAYLTLVTSARLDRHPLTGWVFSPRGSVVFSPMPRQVFRLSAGSSFRNPTLTETHLEIYPSFQTPFPVPLAVAVLGNPDLQPERMMMVEAAYNGRIGPVKATVAGFHYRIRDLITVWADDPQLVLEPPPRVEVRTYYLNAGRETRAWGGEAGVEVYMKRHATAFANLSYQRLSGELDYQTSTNGGPHVKFNTGLRMRRGRVSASIWAHRVGKTAWNNASLTELGTQNVPLDGYLLLNARLGYAFSGLLKGLTAGIEAFNLTDHKHFEILPSRGEIDLGQSGEIIRRRLTASVSYRF